MILRQPVVQAATIGLSGQFISNQVLTRSVVRRIQQVQIDHPEALEVSLSKAQVALQTELGRKQGDVHRMLPYGLVTVMLACFLSLRTTSLTTTSYIGPPSLVTMSIEVAFLFFFGALDNIQDEVSSLGDPTTLEIAILGLGTISTLLLLLRSNQVYAIKSLSILFGTTVAKTNDTKLWKWFGPIAALGVALSSVWQLQQPLHATSTPLSVPSVSGGGDSPISSFLWPNVLAGCLVSMVYEKVVQRGNPLGIRPWWIGHIQSGLLHFGHIWIFSCLGWYPLYWIPRELIYQATYLYSKISQHRRCLTIVERAQNLQTQIPPTTTRKYETRDYAPMT